VAPHACDGRGKHAESLAAMGAGEGAGAEGKGKRKKQWGKTSDRNLHVHNAHPLLYEAKHTC